MKHHYCSGSCHGQPSGADIANGKESCDSQGCSMEGESFAQCECEDSSIHSASAHQSAGHHEHDQK